MEEPWPQCEAGQKGIRILAPIVGVRRKKDAEANKEITKQNERVLLGFRNAYVFDISQTDGVDLPALNEVTGDPGESIDRLVAFLNGKGIALSYNEKISPALGMSYGGRIVLLPGESKAETFSTLVHETAHELLHRGERRTATTKIVRETEAEAVAFVVGRAVGLVNDSPSASYIQPYHGNASLLGELLEVIQQTASVIILATLQLPISEDVPARNWKQLRHNHGLSYVRIGRHTRTDRRDAKAPVCYFLAARETPCGFLPALSATRGSHSYYCCTFSMHKSYTAKLDGCITNKISAFQKVSHPLRMTVFVLVGGKQGQGTRTEADPLRG